METSPFPLKGYVQHSWPMSSEGFSTYMYHTYCDTGQHFIRITSEDRWDSQRLAVELSLPILATWVCPDRDRTACEANIVLFQSCIIVCVACTKSVAFVLHGVDLKIKLGLKKKSASNRKSKQWAEHRIERVCMYWTMNLLLKQFVIANPLKPLNM